MRRFIECLIPITACNLKCSYCYIIQEGRRKNEKAVFRYSPETIGKALSKERLGGISLISITGSGETFIPTELPYITKELLNQGHFINITTNGTLSKQINSFLDVTEGYHSHVHISFSFHYSELKQRHLLDTFFENVINVHSRGCSILVQINLSDEYFEEWDVIKKICIEKIGAFPQVALTRDESNGTYRILTKHSTEEYIAKAREMESPLFEFTLKNFMVKRKEFCYAGLWSAKLNLATGEISGCYGAGVVQNIFEDVTKPIEWAPIGNNCPFKYCFNSSHFLSQGNIPELLPLPSYGELRNRENAKWYGKEMKEFLYSQFEDTNCLLNKNEYWKYNLQSVIREKKKIVNRIINKLQNVNRGN